MTPGHTQSENPPRTRRRWFAFRLRTLLLLITALALWLGYMVHAARVQRETVAAFRALGGDVEYYYEFDSNGVAIRNPIVPGPTWLTDLLTVDFFNHVLLVYVSHPGEHHLENMVSHLRCLTHLTNLKLEGFGLRDDDLKNISGMKMLFGLALSGNEITGSGLKNLTAMKNLYELDISNNPITDEELQHIIPLRPLLGINLSGTQVTDRGLDHLLELPHLKFLTLRNTAISDAGLESLAKLPNLSQLDLQQTRVTSDGIHRLQMALPNLKIISDYDRAQQAIQRR